MQVLYRLPKYLYSLLLFSLLAMLDYLEWYGMSVRIIVTDYIYPSLHTGYEDLNFHDQYALRPSSSTTAAIVSTLHTVTSMLETNPYVCVTALDFSKAFDTVHHYTLLQKMSKLNIPDCIYNWLTNYFEGLSHCVRYAGEVCRLSDISASIIQGSAIGPASYAVYVSCKTSIVATDLSSPKCPKVRFSGDR